MGRGDAGDGPQLRTSRLAMDPFSETDIDELHRLFTEPSVRRYLLDGEVVARAWVEAEVRASRARFAEGSGGLWALRLLGTEPIAGFVGFRPFFEPPEIQLLYGLGPGHWGRGLATEAARAAIEFATARLEIDEVRAAADLPNTASIAVLRRLGMEECRRTDDGEHGTVFFRLGRSGGSARRP